MYVPSDRRIPVGRAAILLGVSPSRIYQFAASGRLRKLAGVSPATWGRKHCVLLDALQVMELCEQRAANPPRPGRPRKNASKESV